MCYAYRIAFSTSGYHRLSRRRKKLLSWELNLLFWMEIMLM